MARRPLRFTDSTPRESADRIALATAFIFGACGSVYLKLTDIHPGFAALWAAIVLFGYVIAVWSVGNLQTEPETTGDNCYYLGFVFTLTSLAVTLYQMGDGEVGQGALQDVISGFGIALSSTIVGIVLRVWLMRLRPDIVARDREARIELHTAIRRFRTALADSATAMKRHSVESLQIMGEERSKLSQMTEEMTVAHRESLKSGANHQLEVLERTMKEGSEKSIATIASTVESAFETSSKQFERQVSEIRENTVEFVKTESETMRRMVDELMHANKGVGEMHEVFTKILNHLDQLAKQLEDATEGFDAKLKRTSEAIEVSASSAGRRIDASFVTLAAAVEQFAKADHYQRTAKALEDNFSVLEQAANRFSSIVRSLEEDARKRIELSSDRSLEATKEVKSCQWFLGRICCFFRRQK